MGRWRVHTRQEQKKRSRRMKKAIPLLAAGTLALTSISSAWAEEAPDPLETPAVTVETEPEVPVEPEAPEEPETSAEPEISVEPTEPEPPAEPEISVEPDTPVEPDTSTEPETPVKPEIPTEPETPEEPAEPPADPEIPEESTEPEIPAKPDTSTEPEESVEPEEPEIPVEPETPAEPEEPQSPSASQQPEEEEKPQQKPVRPTGEYGFTAPTLSLQKPVSVEDFRPSETLLPKALRVKYSTDMPLEGIPAFITAEMITGALKVQDEYGYPASVTIAQIIQESGFGTYGPHGEEGQGLSYLAFQYNNLFGIKGEGPAGSVQMKTGEETKEGQSYTIRAGFRVYHTYSESMEDRAELLKEVYSDLTEGVKDANTFAMRIAGRWATDNDYGKRLIDQMETYDLYRLDRLTLEEFDSLLGDFADPCPGSQVTSEFGWRQWSQSYHKGIDLGTGSENIPTYAVMAGTVVEAGWGGSAGNWIIIDHGDGIVTKYMHHSEMYVQAGDEVEKGEQIGLSGTTGRSTGNHLHFQLEIEGEAVDPYPYLFPEEEKGQD